MTRTRTLVALAAVTGALALPAFAAVATEPSTLAVPPAGSSSSATFAGTVPPGSSPTSTCSGSTLTSTNTIGLTVPAGTYDTVKTVATFTITWKPVTDANVNDEVLTVVGPDGKVVGSSDTSGTSETVTTVDPKAGTYTMIACGSVNAQDQPYTGLVTLDSTDRAAGTAAAVSSNVEFLQDGAPAFAPSTVVSAHLLGGEPQTTVARPATGVAAGVVDPKAVLVDWPLSSRAMTGILNRSQDGGDSFRLLFDPLCAARSRPNCNTGGGGDTESEINPYTGHVLFGDQEVLAQEALATSFDQGDSFPATSSFGGTSAATAVDRQWLAAIDPAIPVLPGQKIQAFYTYHVPLAGEYVVAVNDAGVPVPQPAPQIPNVSQSGQVRVDNTDGPGRGWIYQPYRTTGYQVATAKASEYATPAGWKTTAVGSTATTPDVFPWLSLDTHGNVYAVWVNKGRLFYSYSLIDAPKNNPLLGGRPGTQWTAEQIITPPGVGSAIFPEVVAGEPGKIAIAFDGTSDYSGVTDGAPPNTRWHTYVAVVENALNADGGKLRIRTGKVNHRIVHTGNICTSGTTCAATMPEKDRSLLDLIDIGLDADGRVGVVYTDNNSTLQLPSDPEATGPRLSPFVHFAKQVAGPSLTSSTPVAVPVTAGSATDAAGDATWLNRKDGTLLPSLDELGLGVGLEGDQLVARLPLAKADAAAMTADLATYNSKLPASSATPAQRLHYVVRFETNRDDVTKGRAGDVFHLSFEQTADGKRRAFGGRLDANDSVTNGSSMVAAGYHTDVAYPVTSTVEGSTLVLRAPAAAYGLTAGQSLFSVTGFATAGPTEANETLFANLGRTVDATPPFDVVLGGAAATPSASTATSAPPAGAASASPSGPAPAPAPSSSPDQGCAERPSLALDRTSIVPGEAAGVTVRGRPGTPVELRAYSQPSTTYRVARRAVLAADGTARFGVTPGTSTRMYAACGAAGPDGPGSSASTVLQVRAVVSLSVLRNGVRDYTLQGRNLPRRGGQLITVFRRVGGREVILEQTRTDTSGTWRVRHRFTGTGSYSLVARTGRTVVNAAGVSGVVPTTIR